MSLAARLRIASLASVLALLHAAPSAARLVFDASDAAFDDAVVIPLDASSGFVEGDPLHEIVSDGHTFQFSTTAPNGLIGGFGQWLTSFREGVTVDISPPVGAIGFHYELAECVGHIEVTGAAGSEVYATPFGTYDVFLGAAEIGAISRVFLNDPCYAAAWSEMRFVPGPGDPPPTDSADLSLAKGGPGIADQDDPGIVWPMTVANAGPDAAAGARVVDFLPTEAPLGASDPPANEIRPGLVEQSLGAIANGAAANAVVETAVPPFEQFGCQSTLVNFARTTSSSLEPDASDNDALAVVRFDESSRRGTGEICGNGRDDDCNGRADCGDFACDCRPSLPGGPNECFGGLELVPLPDGTALVTDLCNGVATEDSPAPGHACTVPRGVCGGVTLPAFCCDPRTWSDPSAENLAQLAQCDVGVPGCAPRDPNRKESNPPVNAAGYAYAEPGQRIEYVIRYENVGNADAHDVVVIDPLDPDLDVATLAIEDGGVFDPATRTITWRDPVVPPATPRAVRFSVHLRADAEPATRARNVATIVFPDADPPTRIDTNFVEHAVLDPAHPVVADLRVLGCTEAAPGAWTVRLLNDGLGFAYDVEASIDAPPAAVAVQDGRARFSHPTDPAPDVLASVIPSAYTESDEPVRVTTETPGDPCGALRWRIRWENLRGDVFETVVQSEPDADRDAVADARDNCPNVANASQADADGDGTGDACEPPPPGDLALAVYPLQIDGAWKVALRWPRFPDPSTRCDVLRSVGANAPVLIHENRRGDAGKWADRDVVADETYTYTLVCRTPGAEPLASSPASASTSGPGTPPPPLAPLPKAACGLLGVEALLPALLLAARRRRRAASCILGMGEPMRRS
jgi:uncharacterized repeat protein (TIGR01451 family)